MALVLGVAIGDVVDIAAHWVAILSVDSTDSATLINDDGLKIAIFADQMTEMSPEVWVGLGPDAATSRLRLLVDAPRHMTITRRRD
jgi:hypothetical protein